MAGHGQHGVLVASADIDHAFIPRPAEGTKFYPVVDGAILIGEALATVDALDPVGALVWKCFDGTVDLGSLGSELAAAFGAPVVEVRNNVIGLARTLGARGLLDGVRAPEGTAQTSPTGLEPGESITPFSIADLAGNLVQIGPGTGRRVLLVNWSPTCGYCVKIGPELVSASVGLAGEGIELVLLAAGDAAGNRELLESVGGDGNLRVALRDLAATDFSDPFPGMGTPAAYLLDADGSVAAPLAYGAFAVPDLLRSALGRPAPVESADDLKRYLPGHAGAACGPGAGKVKKQVVWRPTVAYGIGSYTVGVRTDSEQADAVVAQFLAAHAAPADPLVPANYSLALPGAAGRSRELNLLQAPAATVVRSRSAARVLRALAARLSAALGDSEGSAATESELAVLAVAVVGPQGAFLLPGAGGRRVQQLQPRLARLGLRMVDEPHAVVDLDTSELVVPSPRITLDLSALDGLEVPGPSRTELEPVAPGRYPLAGWLVAGNSKTHSRAERVSAMLGTALVAPTELHDLAIRLDEFASRVPVLSTTVARPHDVTERLRTHLAPMAS